jgi:hypothetical protein
MHSQMLFHCHPSLVTFHYLLLRKVEGGWLYYIHLIIYNAH